MTTIPKLGQADETYGWVKLDCWDPNHSPTSRERKNQIKQKQ